MSVKGLWDHMWCRTFYGYFRPGINWISTSIHHSSFKHNMYIRFMTAINRLIRNIQLLQMLMFPNGILCQVIITGKWFSLSSWNVITSNYKYKYLPRSAEALRSFTTYFTTFKKDFICSRSSMAEGMPHLTNHSLFAC